MSEGLIILYVLFVWIAIGTVVVLYRRLRGLGPTELDVAREALLARYARGELTHEEYERQRQALGAGSR
ncbi:MAG TPA: SHOCT domain-containing protein [Methylomirabilota bacterium]|jgi:uncharacterized membrane protein|nr:SHOCT domain-containing protein [Methylomirabilota bacterium]